LSSWICIWLLWLSEHILEVIIVVISFTIVIILIDHGITHLLITSLPDEVGLAEYVCTHLFVVVFLAADPDYVSEEFE
jgi:hypothetical protein